MTLRTAGLIAGVIGVVLLLVGWVATMIKPSPEANPSVTVTAQVVVVPPEVIAISHDATLTFTGNGTLAAHTARTQDVEAWTASRTALTVTGIGDWFTLSGTTEEPTAVSSPSPSASPSGSASPSASASPSPTASGSPSPSPAPSETAQGSDDIWRDSDSATTTYRVTTASLTPGLSLVVEPVGGASIESVAMNLPRVVDDEWITQVLWWGVGLSVLGLIALIARFIDVRPAQSKGEEWLASRSAVGSGKGEAKPGSRRARRAQGAAVPVVEIPAEAPMSGSIPVVEEPQTAPPDNDDEEGRS